MTRDDADGPAPRSGATPGNDAASGADEEAVRRILASLGSASGEPPRMPRDVADRLDAVLAGLAADRAPAATPSSDGGAGAPSARPLDEPKQDTTVTDLAARRRRWPKVLVAAAAVSVVGFGIGQAGLEGMLGGSGGDTMTAESAGGQAADSGDNRTLSEGGGYGDDAGGSTSGEKSPTGEAAPDDPGVQRNPELVGPELAPLLRLRSESLQADAQRLADFTFGGSGSYGGGGPPSTSCDVPALARQDVLFAVRLDGRPATLVFRKAEAGVRDTDVFACRDGSAPVASTAVRTN